MEARQHFRPRVNPAIGETIGRQTNPGAASIASFRLGPMLGHRRLDVGRPAGQPRMLGEIHCTQLVGAALLLAVIFYAAFDFLLGQKRRIRITGSSYLRLALLAGIVLSGALIVIKNFPYVHFSDGLIIGVDLFHIGMAMALLVMNLLCLTMKKRWTAST
jgi:hypothetical protein